MVVRCMIPFDRLDQLSIILQTPLPPFDYDLKLSSSCDLHISSLDKECEKNT